MKISKMPNFSVKSLQECFDSEFSVRNPLPNPLSGKFHMATLDMAIMKFDGKDVDGSIRKEEPRKSPKVS